MRLEAQPSSDEPVEGERVVFQGGEPLLDLRLEDRVRDVRSRGALDVVLQTNARTLTHARAVALRAAGVGALDVSLHGVTAAMHDFHTQAPGSFEETLAGMRAAREAGLVFGVSVVVTRSNFRHLAEIVALVAELGATAVHFVAVAPHGRALTHAAMLVPPPALVADPLAHAVAIASKRALRVVLADRPDPLFAGLGATAPLAAAGAGGPPQEERFQSATSSC